MRRRDPAENKKRNGTPEPVLLWPTDQQTLALREKPPMTHGLLLRLLGIPLPLILIWFLFFEDDGPASLETHAASVAGSQMARHENNVVS